MTRTTPAAILICAIVLGALMVHAQTPAPAGPAARETGISLKKPVLAASCRICPWGALAEVVQQTLAPYGYDVRICYNCARTENPQIVAGARTPPPLVPVPYIAPSQLPAPPNAPVDFGVTMMQNVWSAYHGTGAFAADGPRTNLRLIANIQEPAYLIVAVKSEIGIADLGGLRAKRWPVRLLTGVGGEISAVLSYYGLSRQVVEAAGGHIGNGSFPEERRNFDVAIGVGSLANAPEYNMWYEVSQKFDLTYLPLPDDLLNTLAQDPTAQRGDIPNGLLRGIDRPIPTIVRTGDVIYGRSDMPDDFAYIVARAMDEHQELLQWRHLSFSYNLRTVWKALDIPLHPGAARYYRERSYMK